MKLRGLLLLCLLIPALAMGQALVTARGSGAYTWSLLQHPNNSCIWTSGTTFPCTVTTTATTAGSALEVLWTVDTGGLTVGPTLSGVTGDGSWTHCTACYGYAGVSGGLYTADASYITNTTGGATTITVTVNTPSGITRGVMQLEVLEVQRSTGTASFDGGGVVAYSSGCSATCAGPVLTPTGTDYSSSGASFGFSVIPPGASYSSPSDSLTSIAFSGWAGALNMSVFSVPSWAQGANQYAVVTGMLLK